MNAEPNHQEMSAITTAWECLDAIARAMGSPQKLELLKVKTLCWQDVRHWFPPDHALTLAECRAIREIETGIKRKLEIGADNDTFHYSRSPRDGDRGREAAYDFGQKLVRWNALIEHRFFDRLLNRKGPLQSDELLIILRGSNTAFANWWGRYRDAIDEEEG